MLLLLIIFAETGIFFGFFLPGDSLLFTAGLLSDTEYISIHISLLIPLLLIGAVVGSTVGYFTGKWASHYLINKQDGFLYKRRYLDMTRDFYGRHGAMAFIMGRFLPIIRTYVTILAGVAHINFPKFFFFNVIGAAIWIMTMVMSGYWLGNLYPGIIDHLELIVVVMILISAIPVILAWLKHRIQLPKEEIK